MAEHSLIIHAVLLSIILVLVIITAFLSLNKEDIAEKFTSATEAETGPILPQTTQGNYYYTTTEDTSNNNDNDGDNSDANGGFFNFGFGGGGGGGTSTFTTTTTPGFIGSTISYMLAECDVKKHGWIDDGFCDDATNIEECSYDGGDCCKPQIEDRFCDECICHLDGTKHPLVPTTTMSSTQFWGTTQPTSCPSHLAEMVGDGICDDLANTYLCDFDGLDCCGEEINDQFCLACECKDPNEVDPMAAGCLVAYMGDSYCDDENNYEACRYDDGDCCLIPPLNDYCTICECKEGEYKSIDTQFFCQSPATEIGNGFCEDGNNNPHCNYDGGDCCNGALDNCIDCNCFNDNATSYIVENCKISSLEMVGNGLCDDEANIVECNFDNGDCCHSGPGTCETCACFYGINAPAAPP